MLQKSFRELKGNAFKGLHGCVKAKHEGTGFHTYESTTKSRARARRSDAREPQKRVTLRHPRLQALTDRPGTGATFSPGAGESWIRKGSKEIAPSQRKRSPPATRRAPSGRMGGGAYKEPRVGSEDWDRPPRRPEPPLGRVATN